MRSYKEQTEKILERIKKHEREQKRRKIIYSISSMAASLAILIGCITIIPKISKSDEAISKESLVSADKDNNAFNLDNNATVTDKNNTGIYIPAIQLPEKQDNAEQADMIALIVYKGKIYTQAEYLKCDKANKDNIKGEKLGTASGTIDEWSKKDEYDTEFASNVTGDVYSVKGYDSDFRICIPQMYDGCEFMAFFENLNDVTLSVGADLYENKLRLKENYKEVAYQTHEDWDRGQENYYSINGEAIKDMQVFIDVLNVSPFVNLTNSNNDIYTSNIKQGHIYFKMKDGTTVGLRLFENGYVSYSGMYGRIFVKMDNEIFRKIFNEITK